MKPAPPSRVVIATEPLCVFSHTAPGPRDLGGLWGRRLAVGPEGSGTRAVALTLLAANGITAGRAQFLPLAGEDAVQALRRGEVDTVFLARRETGHKHHL